MTVEKWSYLLGCAFLCALVSTPARAVPSQELGAQIAKDMAATATAAENESPQDKARAAASAEKAAEAKRPLNSVSIPEPSNLLMLALGVAGLITGRLAARRRRKKA